MRKHTFICFALTLCFFTPDALMAQGPKECQRVVPRSDLTKKQPDTFFSKMPHLSSSMVASDAHTTKAGNLEGEVLSKMT